MSFVYNKNINIVIISETFSKDTGYIQNALPKALVKQGARVHLISTELPPYHQIKEFKETYGSFNKGLSTFPEIENYDGYLLHIQKSQSVFGYIRIRGLWKKLKEIKPDIVQTNVAIGFLPLEAVIYKIFLKFSLFTGNHTTVSVFPLARRRNPYLTIAGIKSAVTRWLPGRIIALGTYKCYPATIDCFEVVTRFFGVPRKLAEVCELGVDTKLFYPIESTSDNKIRMDLREKFKFFNSDIVLIYTGRFTNEKNPLILAMAIQKIRKSSNQFKGLFLGDGPQKNSLLSFDGCQVHNFVDHAKLRDFYISSDIGVWPTQESMSMLDAAACGLPIIVNDTLVATERINGNGLQYKLNDVDDLARVILKLENVENRQKLGYNGSKKIKNSFSWDQIAKRRLIDYYKSIKNKNNENI